MAAALPLAAQATAMSAGPGAHPPPALLASGRWQDALGAARTLGEGDMRRWGLRIYHARLLGERLPVPGDAPFALELTYYRAITRERIVAASLDEMRRLSGPEAAARQSEAWRQLLERCFVDVRAGDQLTGLYLPGRGVRFYRGEQLLADVPDEQFARAFFAIWLDPRTRDADLRARLLGATGGQHGGVPN